jgi:3-oxoacyl-[acyl-carrier-protein] synthase-3
VLFGDGAGAVVLKAGPGEGTLADRGVLATHIRSDGRYKDKLYVDGGAGSTKTVGFLRMEGKEVFKPRRRQSPRRVGMHFKETG